VRSAFGTWRQAHDLACPQLLVDFRIVRQHHIYVPTEQRRHCWGTPGIRHVDNINVRHALELLKADVLRAQFLKESTIYNLYEKRAHDVILRLAYLPLTLADEPGRVLR
jgi:hypothetical protein